MDFSTGLRKLFGLNPDPARTRQLEQQEQAILQPVQPLRQAPVQAAPIVPTGVPALDEGERQRAEREMLLKQELMRLQGGQ